MKQACTRKAERAAPPARRLEDHTGGAAGARL